MAGFMLSMSLGEGHMNLIESVHFVDQSRESGRLAPSIEAPLCHSAVRKAGSDRAL